MGRIDGYLTEPPADPERERLEKALDRIIELVYEHKSAYGTVVLSTWQVLRDIQQTATAARRGGQA